MLKGKTRPDQDTRHEWRSDTFAVYIHGCRHCLYYFENQSKQPDAITCLPGNHRSRDDMLYRVPAPRNFIYATDEFSKRVAAIELSNTRLKAVILAEHPPEFELDLNKTDHETDIPSSIRPGFALPQPVL